MPAILVIGEALVDLFADPGQSLAKSKSFTPRFGGAPANVAVSAAKLGGDVGFIGRVGADSFGDGIIECMAGWGVDTSLVVRDPNRATMLSCVALPSPKMPDFLLLPGANENLVSEDIPGSALEDTKILVFGSVTLAYDSAAAVLDGAKRAIEAGCEVIFDVNLRPNVWPDLETARKLTLNTIDISSVIKLNMDECEFLFGHRDPNKATETLLKSGAALICISDGTKGSTFVTANANANHPSYVVEAIDATGSGDAFLAAVAVLLSASDKKICDLSSDELKSMAAFANAAGAFVATKLGAMEADFTQFDVRKLCAWPLSLTTSNINSRSALKLSSAE